MITIQAEFTQKQCDLGLIGRVGENASRQIVFDCAEALRAFPGADILCIYQRPGEGAPYLAPLSGEKGVYTLVLADTDVALPGFARMELRAEKGGKIVPPTLPAKLPRRCVRPANARTRRRPIRWIASPPCLPRRSKGWMSWRG